MSFAAWVQVFQLAVCRSLITTTFILGSRGLVMGTDALEAVKATLLEIVQAGLQSRPDGVHLTFVGSQFAKRMEAPFEQYIGYLTVANNVDIQLKHRKLMPFMVEYMNDVLVVKQDSASGRDTVLLREQGSDLGESGFSAISISSSTRFKRPIWAAFVRPLPEGFRRFIDVENVAFKDAERKPPGPEWVEVESRHIAGVPIDQPIDGPLVQANIGAWGTDKKVDLTKLAMEGESEGGTRASIADLLRIIKSLPMEVTQSWQIPADVLRHLRIR